MVLYSGFNTVNREIGLKEYYELKTIPVFLVSCPGHQDPLHPLHLLDPQDPLVPPHHLDYHHRANKEPEIKNCLDFRTE